VEFRYRFEAPLAVAAGVRRAAGRVYTTLHAQTIRAQAALDRARTVRNGVVPPQPGAIVARIDDDRFFRAARCHEAGARAAFESAQAAERPGLTRYLEAKRRHEAFERDRERAWLRFRLARERVDEAEDEEANHAGSARLRRREV
jgi:hypothetical protein